MKRNRQDWPNQAFLLPAILWVVGLCCYVYPAYAGKMSEGSAQNYYSEKIVGAITKGVKNATSTAPIDETAVVYINIATEDELCSLPGIGPKKAQDIIAYRQKHPFRRLNQLLNIKGIGRKTLERLQPFVKLDMQKPVVSATTHNSNAPQNNPIVESSIPPLLRRPE